ncbi:protein MAINTENANCE OF MERISTEMS-like [Gossypium hirsutum]|uniref:Protein MAINTENANCE OF MERISTEMS-like n=1 Tax=Gossypium hirsutum TaxID=3635 RepID=A0A1U8KPC5_GOSHI|nr:protein MAINTENANCE OF MERISTEMS-like [Gossypium hirsutum]
MPYLEQAGFESATLIRTFDLRYDLLSTLVERWRPETHTFHFPCGECTVTLEDVALQLGLQIDGSPVTGVGAFAEPTALCYSLLGDSLDNDESNFSGLKFTWLKGKFRHLSANATEGELMCAARAYIMHIIGGVLMPSSNNNKVHIMYLPNATEGELMCAARAYIMHIIGGVLMLSSNNNKVHIMYLPLLADLSNVRSYSWGSAVLAVLYRELCRTTKPTIVDMGGCLTLLQSWALYRMPFLASISHQPYVYPLVNRYQEVVHCPDIPSDDRTAYRGRVEWYHGDRVLRQFGCVQYIPDPPCEVGVVHGINKRGKPQLN